jgi:hypothetical protein
MKHNHFNLPTRDEATQRLLDNAFAVWHRHKHGVATLGCALVLSACGSGDGADAPPDRTTQPPNCGPKRERCL